jgi:hypothetical protein
MQGSLINAGQLYSIGRDVQQVQQTANTILQVSMAGTALAGLGVVTSVAGFAYLSQRNGATCGRAWCIPTRCIEVKRNQLASRPSVPLWSNRINSRV